MTLKDNEFFLNINGKYHRYVNELATIQYLVFQTYILRMVLRQNEYRD